MDTLMMRGGEGCHYPRTSVGATRCQSPGWLFYTPFTTTTRRSGVHGNLLACHEELPTQHGASAHSLLGAANWGHSTVY
ncbi:hypothetical protein ACOMHN_008082 [Nucella lapillus]